ncbi:MAG TPA: DNA mismatch repair protein MutS, partial [Sphingomicrobium sp.]|nr:DNA mismatch repair protein MutS [Sphingomicrobium sp.]
MRSLSPEEAELWARVAATIRPLSRDKSDAPAVEAITPPAPTPKTRVSRRRATQLGPKRTENLRTATLDGSWDRRLASGRVEPDRVVDLHGH